MPTTIKQGFEKLKQNLEITGLQESTVSTRQTNVRDAVASELSVLEPYLTGSYRRNTLIAPLGVADIDMVVVLDPKYYEADGYAGLLDKVKRVLRKTYTKTPDISRNGQAVTITFTDFKVDVVPAFYRTGGGYLIPDSAMKRWIATDPKRHVQIWSEANAAHSYDLVPLIKMIKAWNKMHSALLRSFHLEALVLGVLTGVTISDYPSGVRFSFDKARAKVMGPFYDPAGYGGDLGAYLDTLSKKQEVVGRFEAGYRRAYEAEELEKSGKTAQAYEKWRMIFGDYFPIRIVP
jgi:hypothetical protein